MAKRVFEDRAVYAGMWRTLEEMLAAQRPKQRRRSARRRAGWELRRWVRAAIERGQTMGGRQAGLLAARMERRGRRLAEEMLLAWGGEESIVSLALALGRNVNSVGVVIEAGFMPDGIAIAAPEKGVRRLWRGWQLSPYGRELQAALRAGARGLRLRGDWRPDAWGPQTRKRPAKRRRASGREEG